MSRYHVLAAALSLSTVVAGCVVASQPEDVGDTAEALTGYCATNQWQNTMGDVYAYTWGGAAFTWSVLHKSGQAQVGYRNQRTDGSWGITGTISRWSACPTAPEPIRIITSAGVSSSCTHICLNDGRQEINCPTVQLELTRLGPSVACTTKDVPNFSTDMCSKANESCQSIDQCKYCCAWHHLGVLPGQIAQRPSPDQVWDDFVCAGVCEAIKDPNAPGCRASGTGGGGTGNTTDPLDQLSCIPGYPNSCVPNFWF